MKKIISVFFLCLFLACQVNDDEKQKDQINDQATTIRLTKDQVIKTGLVLGSVNKMTISSTLRLNGKIDVPPQNVISVSIPLGGYLKSTALLPGMKIKKGEVIATIEDLQYIQLQQDYLTTKAGLIYSENELKRQKSLNENNAGSLKTVQQSEAEYQKQRVMLSALSEKLKLINIDVEKLDYKSITATTHVYSPIDGYVSAINVNIGKYVNPSDVVFELVNPSDIHLALTVFEKDIDKLEIGQKLNAFTNTKPEIKYPCEIILIGQKLSAERSVEVHCHFNNYDKTLLPGMYMNAVLELNSHEAMVIPQEAVVTYEGKDYIMIEKEPEVFMLTEVKTGLEENGQIELITDKPIKQGSVVMKGAYALLMALKNKQD